MTRRLRLVCLTDKQRHKVMVAAVQLPPAARYGFILRVERKLHLRGTFGVTDKLLEAIITNVLTELQEPAGGPSV